MFLQVTEPRKFLAEAQRLASQDMMALGSLDLGYSVDPRACSGAPCRAGILDFSGSDLLQADAGGWLGQAQFSQLPGLQLQAELL